MGLGIAFVRSAGVSPGGAMIGFDPMGAAFLLRVRRSIGAEQLPPAPSSALEPRIAPSSDALGFVLQHQHEWTNLGGSLRLNVWVGGGTPSSCALTTSEDGVAFVVGDVRRRGGMWGDPSRWSSEVAAVPTQLDPAELQQDLRGVFLVGKMADSGDGWIVPDMLGLRCLYFGESGDELVVGSRAELVAQAITQGSTGPARDLAAVCRLAFTSYWLGDRTGFAGVRVAPPGVVLRFRAGAPSFEHSSDILTFADRSDARASMDEIVEQVYGDVAESLLAALDRPGSRHFIQLTGGKDSRLILAVAVRAGLAHHFEYLTSGPDELADVQIASELCETLGLHHEKRFIGQRGDLSFGETRRRFVRATGGMMSGWEAPGPGPDSEVWVSGVGGELLRSFQKVPARLAGAEPTAEIFNRRRFGRLGLLDPALAEELYGEIAAGMSTAHPEAHAPLDRMHAYLAGSRMRYTRLGPREEVADGDRLLPLYSPQTLRAAMQLDPIDRQSDVLSLEVMSRCSAVLVNHRFTGSGWDERALRRLHADPGRSYHAVVATRADQGGPHPPAIVKEPSLMQSLYSAPSDERSTFLAGVFANLDNPIWSLLSRPKAAGALEGWNDLDVVGRRELFGAASAALWADH